MKYQGACVIAERNIRQSGLTVQRRGGAAVICSLKWAGEQRRGFASGNCAFYGLASALHISAQLQSCGDRRFEQTVKKKPV